MRNLVADEGLREVVVVALHTGDAAGYKGVPAVGPLVTPALVTPDTRA